MMRTNLALFAIPVLLAINTATDAVTAVDGHFQLQRLENDSWRAEWCYSEAVDALRFDRPVERFRETSWKPADEAFELRVDGDYTATFRRKDDEPFSCAALSVQTWTERPEKNYYAFSPFSDGGVSVYTGYFRTSVQRSGRWRETLLSAEYVGRDGDRVITRDQDLLVEQFVYFGRQALLETPALIAVIDPAMPTAARSAILETIPAVNELLAEKFDFKPASPYMVFMATELDVFDGFSSKGGALRDQVLFTLKGQRVPDYLEKNPKHFPKSTAHEVIHLWQWDQWNGSLGQDSQDQPWIHEGSADALALEVMRVTGIHDDEEYAQAWRDVEARCMDNLEHSSIHGGPESGSFDVVYQCGALVNRLVGEMLNPADPGEGIVRFWQAMVEWPPDARQHADETLFFRTLEKLGIDAPRSKALRQFLDLQTDQPEQALAELRVSLAVSPVHAGRAGQ